MIINTGEKRHGFRLEQKAVVEELDGECLLFRHEKSGARLLKVISRDDNKVFAVTFKTPPPDDSGLPHIMEHSVLNGSETFPVKSPFDVLSQGSLKTFLNAMTGSDMTIYPVASRNDKDFFNLMHVYLDAVFRPLLFREPNIFFQEGWHYELDSPESKLVYKGVVYNEMKGAFSAPQRQLDFLIGRTLFPDNCYSKSSGGHPDAIPNLDYERFTAFHTEFYHPANSFIFLYGNGEIEKELAFINEKYLSFFEKTEVNSAIPIQMPPDNVRDVIERYPLPKGSVTDKQCYIAWAGVLGRNTDQETTICLEILADALVNHQSGPLRLAMQKAGIGQDIGAFVDKSQQPVFQITVDNAGVNDLDRFKKVLIETLHQVVNDGLDRTMIEGIINRMEFSLREGQGVFTGVSGALMAAPGWLFADDPFLTLSFNRELVEIRRKIEENELEKLVERLFLKNKHACFAHLIPEEGLEVKLNERLEKHLAEIQAGMKDQEVETLVNTTRELKAYQQRVDSPEALGTIPLLELGDIDEKETELSVTEKKIDGVTLLELDEFTRGIIYFSLYLDACSIEQELIPYLQLYNQLIGLLDTEKYSYGELENQINLHTGGISSTVSPLLVKRDDQQLRCFFVLKGKVMPEKSNRLLELMSELLIRTDWGKDRMRLKELILRLKTQTEQDLTQNGFHIAVMRLNSYLSNRGAYRELISGHSYYLFLCDLADHFEEKAADIIGNLMKVQNQLVNRRSMMLSLTCHAEQSEPIKKGLGDFLSAFPSFPVRSAEYRFSKEIANEGFKDTSKVQYVAKGFDFKCLGHEYNGRMEVLSQLLSTVYLQNTVRVMGGAYGGFSILSENGTLILASYRDPNLKKTIRIFNGASDFLKHLDMDERSLRRLIIGTISKRDFPREPYQKASLAVERYITGIDAETRQKERLEILTTKLDDLRRFSGLLADVMKQNAFCVVGSELMIEKRKELFRTILNLRKTGTTSQ